jgi:hypothetical protein
MDRVFMAMTFVLSVTWLMPPKTLVVQAVIAPLSIWLLISLAAVIGPVLITLACVWSVVLCGMAAAKAFIHVTHEEQAHDRRA